MSYRQGSWFAVAGPKACVLLPGSEKQRAVELWSMVDAGADFDDVLDTLVARGLRGLSGFVLLSGDTDVRVLVRGESVVSVRTDSGTRELTGLGTLTWTEASIPEVNSVRVVVDLADGAALSMRGGLVRVGELEISEESAHGAAAPLPSTPAIPVAVPVADPLGLDDESFDAPGVGLAGSGLGGAGAALAGAAPLLSVVPDPGSGSESVVGPYEEGAYDEGAYDEGAYDEAQWRADEADLVELLDETADDDGMATAEGPQASHLDDDVVDEILGIGPDDSTDVDIAAVTDPLGAPPAWTPDVLGPPPPLPPTGMPPLPPLALEDPLGQTDAPLGPPPAWTPAPLADTDDEHFDLADPEDENPTEFIAQAFAEPAIPAAPSGPTLVFSDGQSLAADHTIVVGRAPDPSRSADPSAAGIRVPSPHQEISSTHIEIQPGEGHAAVIVTDLGSTNGTVVVQPGAGPEELRAGVPVAVITGTMIDLGDSLTIHVED